jgi:uncharacterized membrane protein (DUF2068 family)
MSSPATTSDPRPPGIEKPKRFRTKFHYELIACGFRGHELIGLDAARIRPQDELFVRETDGTRWHRCLRCDSWLPLAPPAHPTTDVPPDRDHIELPLRGRPLRDKFVLRLIAVDRGFHVLIFGLLATAVFLFAVNRDDLRALYLQILQALQGTLGGLGGGANHHTGILSELDHVFSYSTRRLLITGVALSAYAALEGVEMIGLWMGRRWAEYLTFLATAALLPLEIYELSQRVSVLKIVALVLNLAIVAYLIAAKRLFGVRGGVAAERRTRERDAGWEAVERGFQPGTALPRTPGELRLTEHA